MEINTTKESLNVNKTICEKKEIMNIQGDMIVPDSKPDILSTINTSGNVCIYKKEIMEGKLKIDGNILTYIMLGGLTRTSTFQKTSIFQN